MEFSVGDRVRVNEHNDYDKDAAHDPADNFQGKEGVIIRTGQDVVVETQTDTLYHVELEGLNNKYEPENPWPFWGYEIEPVA